MKNALLDRIVATLFTKKTTPKSRMRSAAKLPDSSKRQRVSRIRKLRSATFPALFVAAALFVGAGALQAETIPISADGEFTAPIVLAQDRTYEFQGNYLYDLRGNISGGFGIFMTNTGTPGTLGLYGDNSFTGGMTTTGGTIVLGHDRALGTWTAGNPATTQTGMLLATTGASTIQVTEDRTISNRFNVTGTALTVNFDVAADKTLTVSYVDAGNLPTALGGALYKTGAGTLNVGSGTVFDHNSAWRGGAAYIDAGTATFNGTTFTNNSATTAMDTSSGAAQGGALSIAGGTVNLSNATFSGNSVTAANTITISYGYAYGGALYMSGGTVAFTGDTLFEGNKSTYERSANNIAHGGAIYYTRGTLKFDGDTVFSGNHADGTGGAIYANRALDLSGSTGSLTFTGNSAGYGGGISSSNSSSSSSVSLGDYVAFTGNSAGYSGGGISSSSSFSSSSSVSLGDYVAFTGNSAGSSGGGIYSSSSSSSSSSVSLGSFTEMTGNRARSAGDYGGGAIFTGNDLTLSGNSFFSGNLAATSGGAIFLFSQGAVGANTATLDTGTGVDTGAIAFSGNKSGVTFTGNNTIGYTPVANTGTANSIHLRRNTLLDLKGGGNVYFDDPISSEAMGTFANNTLTKTGTGFVQFVGDSYLNRTASHTYGGGTVTVSGGAFRVVDGASFSTYGTGATFTTATGTTLAGGGTITAQQGFTISGTISPDADRFEIPTFVSKGDTVNGATDSHYNFFLDDKATTVSDTKKIGTLSLVGAVTLDGATLAVDIDSATSYDKIDVTGAVTFGSAANSVAVTGGVQGATYDILTATADMTLAATDFEKITGTAADGYSYTRGSAVQLKTGDDKILQLKLDSTSNTTLTWTGATSGNWHNTGTGDKNWTDGITGGETRFMTGDTVLFDGTSPRTGVSVQAGGVAVADMTVRDKNYSFSGGTITGTGTLTVSNAPSSRITASTALDFDGGIEIGAAGIIQLNTGGLLVGDIVNNGLLNLYQDASQDYDLDGQITGTGRVRHDGRNTVHILGTEQKTNKFEQTDRFDTSAVHLGGAWHGDFEQAGGLLYGTGTIQGAATLAGTVNPGTVDGVGTINFGGGLTLNAATLAVDLSESSYDKIKVTGNVTYNGMTVIDLGNFRSGTYGIVTATETMGALAGYDVKLNGNSLGARQKGVASVSDKSLNLTLSDNHNLDLTWRGGNGGSWDTSTAHWNYGSVATDRTAFQTNDYVKFDNDGTGTVNVQGGGVTVSGMLVTAGTHTFSGGSITGVNAADNGQTRTGKYEQQGGTVTFNNTTSFANGYEITGGTLYVGTGGSIFGNVLNNAQLTFSGTDTKTYGGAISGTGNVTKSGTGTLTLSGTNTYSGTTTVSVGTLSIASDANIGGGTNTLNGGTLRLTGTTYAKNWVLGGTGNRTISSTNDVTMAGDLSGTGGLTKIGGGSLTLYGTNTYTGNTWVSDGTLTVTGNLGSGTYDGNITISANRSIVFNQNSNQMLSGVISSGGTLTKDGAGTLTLSGANTYTGKTTISGGTLLVTGTLVSGNYTGAIENNAALIFNQTANQTLSGVISGTGSLTKQGDNRLTLSGANTYTGTTTLSSGELHLGRSQTFNGAVSTASNTVFALGSYNATLLGSANTISGNVTGTGTLSIGNGSAANLVYAGPSTKSFTGTTHIGAGSSLTLSGTNLNGQRLMLTGTGTVNAGGHTVDLFGTSTFGGTLTDGTFRKTGVGTTTTLTNTNMQAGTANFTVQSGKLDIAGKLTTTGTVDVTANGAVLGLTFSADGATLIADTINFGTNGVLDIAGFSGNVGSGTTYVIAEADNDIDIDFSNVTIGGSTGVDYMSVQVAYADPINNKKELVATGGLSWHDVPAAAHGTFTVNSEVAIGAGLNDRSGDGISSGWDGKTLTKKGTGTLVLSGANTYTGPTNIEAGTLSITKAGALQGTSGVVFANIAGTKVFDLNYAEDGTFAKTVSDAGTESGTLQKSGDARVLLTGVNSFNGATVVKAGTLAVSGEHVLSNTTGVTVESGAVFELAYTGYGWFQKSISGDGSVLNTGDKTVTVNSSSTYTGGTTIAAGMLNIRYVGSLGTGTVDIADDATLQFQIADNGTFSNVITGGGTLQVVNDVTFNRHNTGHTGGVTVDLNKTLTLSVADEWNYENIITGAGNLAKTGAGKLILAGDNGYTGTTTVSTGTLTVTSETSTGTGTANVRIDDGATLELDFTSAGTLAKNIVNGTVSSNTGKLVKSGDNRVALSGTNTFTGATNIDKGTLAVTSAAALSDTSGIAVAEDASFELAYAADGSFDRTISGSGAVAKTGDKAVTMTAASTYSGGTDIQEGTLILTDVAAAGTGNVSIRNDTTLQLGADMTFGNEISGTGTVTIDADVTRQRHDTAFTGNFNVNTDRTLTLDYATDTVFGNVISGAGNVTKADANLLTLSRINTNTGTFTQDAGSVRLNSNWDGNYTQSAGTFTAANNATISGTATFSGDVALDENLNVGSLVFADATVAYDVNNDLFTVTTGGITFSGSNTLNATFASGVQLGTYDIAVVTGGGTVADPSTWTYTLGSTHLDGYNLDARGSGIVRSADNKKLQLRVALDAIDLTWNGTAGAGGDLWTNNPNNDTLGNWTNGAAGNLEEKKFRDGDRVTFDGTAAEKDVNVAAAVTVGTMTVDGATYAFTGTGGISSTSTLELKNSATVTLANNGTNNFGGGTTVNTGSTLNIGSGGTTGNLGGDIANDGTLVLNKSNTYTLDNTISGTGTVRMDGGTVNIGGTGTTQSNAFQQTSGTVHLTQQWTGNYTQTGGILTGDGTISGNLAAAKNVNPDGTLSVTGTANLTGMTLGIKTSDNDVSDKLAVTGAVTLGTGASITTIDILDFRPGEYTILTASGFGTSIDNDTFATKVGGGNLAARQSVDYTNSTGTSVVMTLATLGNVALTWTGSDGDSWRSNNWTTGSAADSFADGDAVTFDDSVVTPQSIYLGTGTNTVASMDVDGGDYTFTGSGGISGTNNTADTEIPNPTGKLTVGGTASVTFANTGTNSFAGGTEIVSGGSVTLGLNDASGSLGGTIANAGELILNRNDDFVFDNEISGSGTTRMIGDGTVTLSGTNTKSNKLEQTAGTIVLDGDWTGDFVQTAGTFSGSGTLNGDATISDTIAPTGTLTLGSVEFIGDSTPGLGATISIGALGTDMIAVNGTTTFDVSSGKIKVDLGTWTLGAGTILDDTLADTLDIGATFEDVTLNGQALSGRQTADLSVLNGDLILTASAQNEIRTWTGAAGNSWDKNNTESWLEDDRKFIDGDKVVFNTTGALVPNVNVVGNLIASEMTVDADTDNTFSGASITTDATTWSGTGTASGKLVKNGTGTATFNNANIFHGGTDLNAGRINVGNNLAFGTLAVRMASDTTIGFTGNHTISNVISLQGDATVDTGSNNAVMTGKIGGNYTLTKDGAGTLTLEAANEHGATNISDGRIVAKRAASLGFGNADIESAATLELDFSGELSNAVSGVGSLENKGDILLSGDHSQFTGTSFVLTGKTTLGDGFDSGSAFDVASTLAGNGRMNGDLIVRTGATLSPGNSVGRIETGGNAIFENGAKYEVEIDIAADEADLLVAAGNVTVGDTSELHVEVLDVASLDSATEYLVIESTGGTINRTFADDYFIEKALYGFTQELRGGNQLYLTLQRKQSNFAGPLAGLGYPNAYNAAAAVDAVDAAGEATKLGSLFDALGNLDVDADTYMAAFTQLHGEVFAASREAAAQTQRRFLRQLPTARDRALKTNCDPCGAANSFKQWNRWANFTGDWLNRNDIGNFSGYDLRTYGVAFGMDKNVTKKLFVGAAFGYDDATLKFDTLRSRDEMDVFRSMLYGGWRSGRTYVDGYVGYTKNWHKTRRDINISDFAGTARSKFDDDMLSTGLEIGRKLRFGRTNLTPSIGLHYIHLSSPSATETGANGANLHVSGGKYDSLRLPVGARINRDFRFNTSRDLWSRMTWTPELRAFYVAELADDSASVRTSFNNVRSIGFTASSGKWGRSSGVFGVGLKGQLSDRLSLRVDYDHEVYEHTDMGEFSVSAGVNW